MQNSSFASQSSETKPDKPVREKMLAKLAASKFLVSSFAIHLGLIALLGGVVIFKAAHQEVPTAPTWVEGIVKDSEEPQAENMDIPEEFKDNGIQNPTSAPAVSPASAIASLTSNASFSINAPSDQQLFGNSFKGKEHTLTGPLGVGGDGKVPGTFFGRTDSQDGSGMTGVYYDLRRNAQGVADPEWTKLSDTSGDLQIGGGDFGMAFLRLCEKLIERNGTISESALAKYYHAPKKMSNYVILMPILPSDGAPAAFGVDKVPGRQMWMVNYRAKLRAEHDGRFRFVGGADELLIVRVNGRLVLDGTWETIPWKAENKNATNWESKGKADGPYSDGWRIGEWFTTSGPFDLEITVGEGWGGAFSGVLAIEEGGKRYENTQRPLFKIEGYQQMLPLIEPAIASKSAFLTLDGPTFQPAK